MIFWLILFSAQTSVAQTAGKLTGMVTYISSSHVYVQFTGTDGIKAGDTLYAASPEEVPVLRVKYISSRSCSAERINNANVKLNDTVHAYIPIPGIQDKSEKVDTVKQAIVRELPAPVPIFRKTGKKNLWGKFSIQSLSNISNSGARDNFQRWRYSFSLGADSIAGSKFGFSSYMFFAYNTRDWQSVKSSVGKALKIYDLSLSFRPDANNRLWAGRHLNFRISNIGSIDGLQYEHETGNLYFGGIVGSHPDFSDYGYNLKMFEYGVYAGRTDSVSSGKMENTVAFFNQTNNFRTDRRYLYYQHTNNIIWNTSLFASTEIDLYKKENGIDKNTATLTSLFVSLYYNPSNLVSLSLSYDARRNVVYYETYKSFIDSLFTNEMRQGYRLSLMLRPFNGIMLSLNGGYRFQKSDIKPSRNFGANFYMSELPFLKVNMNASYTRLISSYTDGNIAGLRFTKYFYPTDLSMSLDIRRTEYKYNFNIQTVVQNSIGADISYRLPLDIYLGINYEGVFEKQRTYGRFFLDLTKRF